MSRSPLAAAALIVATVGVRPTAAPAPVDPDPDRPVFRLSVSLVQLDAVVTDKKGTHVTGLGPSDFIVLQDGTPQHITAVAYVDAADRWIAADGQGPVPAPTSPRDARRVIAFVVDDVRMGFGSVYYTRRALAKIIDQLLLPEDLAGIVTTSGNRGTTWPLTFGRAELKAAANRLRFSLSTAEIDGVTELMGLRQVFDPDAEFRNYVFAIAALERINDVIDSVRELPGRKTIVLLSEGFSLNDWGPEGSLINLALRGLVDRANRAGVVIYAVDPRGLVVTGLTAADSAESAAQAAAVQSERSALLRDTQDGLRFVAAQTGGFAVVNNNDIPGALRRIMDDQRGYYLIGYQPDASTFVTDANRQFRKLKIKVKQKGLVVRTRAGFYARPTE
jgi:VWFA-related protein